MGQGHDWAVSWVTERRRSHCVLPILTVLLVSLWQYTRYVTISWDLVCRDWNGFRCWFIEAVLTNTTDASTWFKWLLPLKDSCHLADPTKFHWSWIMRILAFYCSGHCLWFAFQSHIGPCKAIQSISASDTLNTEFLSTLSYLTTPSLSPTVDIPKWGSLFGRKNTDFASQAKWLMRFFLICFWQNVSNSHQWWMTLFVICSVLYTEPDSDWI